MEWVIPAVAVLLLIGVVVVRGRILALQSAAAGIWSGLDALLQRRHDLIRPLVEIVQRQAPREGRLVDKVLAARKRATAAHAPPAIGRAEGVLGAEVQALFERAETLPDLGSRAEFRRIKAQFEDMGRRIAAAQGTYNAAARSYNTARLGLPGALLSLLIRLEPLEYYGGADAATTERASGAAEPMGL